MCEVALPNKEISFVYSREILSQFESIIPRSAANAIQEAIYKMDIDALQKAINDRAYSAELPAVKVPSIIKMGIAFSGKRARIAAELDKLE